MVFVSYFHNFLCRLLDSFLVLHSFGLNNFWTSFQRVAFSNIYGDYNLDFLDIFSSRKQELLKYFSIFFFLLLSSIFFFQLWSNIANMSYIPYARHYNPLLIRNRSLILTIHKTKILRKKPLEKTFLDFKKWVKNIQTAGYNGARTVLGFRNM